MKLAKIFTLSITTLCFVFLAVVFTQTIQAKTPEEEAAAQRAEQIADAFRQSGEDASVVDNGDGTYTVVCDNGAEVTVQPNPSSGILPPVEEPPPLDIPTDIPLPSPEPTVPTVPPVDVPTEPPIEPPPTEPPTPTKIPSACGFQCTRNSDCQGSEYSNQNVCNVCINNICQVPPTPTPTPTPRPTATPIPTPTPTPTPNPFKPDMCKCDGIEYTDLFSGQPATITSFAKVEGKDVSYARLIDQTFAFYEGTDTRSKRLILSSPIPATLVSQTQNLVRYKSVWNLVLPKLTAGQTYRIQSTLNCQPKLQAASFTPARQNKAVLAEQTENKSFIDRMLDFLNRLFGGVPTQPPQVQTFDNLEEAPTPTGQKSLQLETIYPVEVFQKTCSFIKFRYGNFGQ